MNWKMSRPSFDVPSESFGGGPDVPYEMQDCPIHGTPSAVATVEAEYRYRCSKCHAPMIAKTVAETNALGGTCSQTVDGRLCDGLIEADTRTT